jgi:hypothetical protein
MHDHVFFTPTSVLPRQGGGKKRMPRGLPRGDSLTTKTRKQESTEKNICFFALLNFRAFVV